MTHKIVNAVLFKPSGSHKIGIRFACVSFFVVYQHMLTFGWVFMAGGRALSA